MRGKTACAHDSRSKSQEEKECQSESDVNGIKNESPAAVVRVPIQPDTCDNTEGLKKT